MMDKSDIQYALELLSDGLANKDWDQVYEVKDFLREFLDEENSTAEE